MKKLFFSLSLLGIFLLLCLQTTQKPLIQGEIEKVKYQQNSISILVNSTEIIIFTSQILNLQKGDKIEVYGKKEIYKNKEQIIADKIIKIQE